MAETKSKCAVKMTSLWLFSLFCTSGKQTALYLLANASWASMAVFLPLKVTGLAERLQLFLRTFSVLFFFSLDKIGPSHSFNTNSEFHWVSCKIINAQSSSDLLLLRCLCLLLEFDRDLARLFLSRLLDLLSPLRERDLFLSQFRLWCRLQKNMNLHLSTLNLNISTCCINSANVKLNQNDLSNENTFPLNVILIGFLVWRISCLFGDVAPPCLQTACHGLYLTSPAAPLIRSDISELSQSPSSVPVLRRIGLFQENSAIKRVSKLVWEHKS